MPSEADLIIGIYQRHADEWIKYQEGRKVIEQHWLDRFQALLPAQGSILDIGCGPGFPIAQNFIERGFGITGIDTSPRLLAVCAAKFPDHEWLLRDMRSLSLERQFDGLLAWNSFFHLTAEDQRRMFAIFSKHAARGAPLMFTGGPSSGVAIGTFGGEPLYHASLDPDEYRALLAEHGFDVVMYTPEDPCGPDDHLARQENFMMPARRSAEEGVASDKMLLIPSQKQGCRLCECQRLFSAMIRHRTAWLPCPLET